MNILTWNFISGTIKKDNDSLYKLFRKPILSFNFDAIVYEPENNNAFLVLDDIPTKLTEQQISEVETFIDNYDFTLKHCMNEYGSYVGQHPDMGQFTIVPSAPPTSENWKYDGNQWIYVYGVDVNGHYMGNVPSQLCYKIATSAPSGFLTKWDSDNNVWIDERTDEQKLLWSVREIEKTRDQALADGFMFNGHLHHCDPIFQSQIQAYLSAWREGIIQEDDPVPVRRKDNVIMQMTRTEILALATALMSHVQTVYAQSWAAKDAL